MLKRSGIRNKVSSYFKYRVVLYTVHTTYHILGNRPLALWPQSINPPNDLLAHTLTQNPLWAFSKPRYPHSYPHQMRSGVPLIASSKHESNKHHLYSPSMSQTLNSHIHNDLHINIPTLRLRLTLFSDSLQRLSY